MSKKELDVMKRMLDCLYVEFGGKREKWEGSREEGRLVKKVVLRIRKRLESEV